jgi:hypothetical protein
MKKPILYKRIRKDFKKKGEVGVGSVTLLEKKKNQQRAREPASCPPFHNRVSSAVLQTLQ